MIVFCGYNFCSDGNCIDPVPTNVTNITDTRLMNGIFDRWYATENTEGEYPTTIPDQWDYETIMDADFNDGDLSAGNVAFTLEQITSLRIKRRAVGEFNWITLYDIPVVTEDDLKISVIDTLNKNNTEYEYALVPVLNEIEGDYITNTILSQFDGVYICDLETIFRFYAGVSYGTGNRVQQVGILEPLGRKFPIMVSNSLLNYETGSVTGTVVTPEYYQPGAKVTRAELLKERKDLLDFLTNKKVKVIKDWNGQIYLCFVVDNPSIEYLDGSGMGLANVAFNWMEVGDVNNQQDLYDTGMVEEL